MRSLKEVFPVEEHPQLIVGLDGADDSSVYKLTDEIAIINTVDFFTPVVDDPYSYGMIAAANSLSDVYAMGGDVLISLNVCAFPETLPAEVMAEILKGGADKVRESGSVISGGHTVMDNEPKYGLAVTGIVHPDKLFLIEKARPGDLLFLTKPIGLGLVATALKGEVAAEKHIKEAVDTMCRLNRASSRVFQASGKVVACTDITGFALIGHSLEMAEKSGVGLRFFFNRLPFSAGVKEYAHDSLFPGGTCTNQQEYESHVVFDKTISESERLILFTPETSGGLLAAVPPSAAMEIEQCLKKIGEPYWIVGEVIDGKGIEVNK